jgi:hypothetical protein
MKRIPFIAFLFFMMLSCEKWNEDSSNYNEYPDEMKFHDPILLGYHECISDYGNRNTICFDSVITESRCPENVECIWAGEAIVRFRFEKYGKEPRFIDLHTGTNDTIIDDYKFSFIDLLPYPNTDHPTSPEDYKAKVILKHM